MGEDREFLTGVVLLACSGSESVLDRPEQELLVDVTTAQPDDDLLDIDNTAFGVSQANGMREIVGYTMIEPDGSVLVKVPANTALQISILDADGKRLPTSPRHRNWISLRPGQERHCTP